MLICMKCNFAFAILYYFGRDYGVYGAAKCSKKIKKKIRTHMYMIGKYAISLGLEVMKFVIKKEWSILYGAICK